MKNILMAVLIVVMVAAVGSFVFAHHADGSSDFVSEKVIYYDSNLNDYFDSNGIIVSGQSEGYDINYLRENPPIITEDGSLE